MTPEQIRIQAKRFLFEEQMWTANQRLGEISRACTDHVVIKGRILWSPRQQKVVNTPVNDDCCGASCAICGGDLGWYCPVNPKGYCEYNNDSENCIFCHQPDGRK